jgi:hypothetical protein
MKEGRNAGRKEVKKDRKGQEGRKGGRKEGGDKGRQEGGTLRGCEEGVIRPQRTQSCSASLRLISKLVQLEKHQYSKNDFSKKYLYSKNECSKKLP